MRTAPLLTALLLVGCDAYGVDGEHVPLETSRTLYTATVEGPWIRFEVPLAFDNTLGETVFLGGCAHPDPPALEKRVGGEWTPAYHAIVTLCLSEPVAIRPGETFRYTFRAAAAFPGFNAGPEWLVGDVPGRYRLRWRASTGDVGVDLVSNPFTVTVL